MGGWAPPALHIKRSLYIAQNYTVRRPQKHSLTVKIPNFTRGARLQAPRIPHMADTSWSLSPINNIISLQSILRPSALHFKFFHYNVKIVACMYTTLDVDLPRQQLYDLT